MIGFQQGKCRLCGKDGVLNEGICGAHSSDAAQGYLFGYADGLAAQPPASGGELLKDSHSVHINMLRGEIAKLTPAQVAHLYSDEECAEIVAEIRRQRPKSGGEDRLRDAVVEKAREAMKREHSLGNAHDSWLEVGGAGGGHTVHATDCPGCALKQALADFDKGEKC